jgi:hypothetical protein
MRNSRNSRVALDLVLHSMNQIMTLHSRVMPSNWGSCLRDIHALRMGIMNRLGGIAQRLPTHLGGIARRLLTRPGGIARRNR